MALKGMTKIELTNVKTGEVETVEKHNMVTNALKWALSSPFGWQAKQPPNDLNLVNHIMPICPNVIGGILLYESQIPENPDQLYAQPGNVLVGYANKDVNGTADTMRGSINVNESGPLEAGDGYRFVFDFNTSQGNGAIGAVGLTSKWAGACGPGSVYYKNAFPTILLLSVSDSNTMSIMASAVFFDDSTSIATSARIISNNSIEIDRVFLPAISWPISGGNSPATDAKIVESKTLSTKSFGAKSGGTLSNGGAIFYCNFCYDDGYIWGFEHNGGGNGNSSGVAHVNYIKIDIETLEFTEGTLEIDAQLHHFGNFTQLYTSNISGISQKPSSTILDGFLYCYQYDLKAIVKINLSNITDVKFIDIGINVQKYEDKLTSFGGVVHLHRGYLNGDAFVKASYEESLSQNIPSYYMTSGGGGFTTGGNGNVICFGTYGLHYAPVSYSSRMVFLLLIANYLATINNLPAPVEKTADKTMKITYIIREEAET